MLRGWGGGAVRGGGGTYVADPVGEGGGPGEDGGLLLLVADQRRHEAGDPVDRPAPVSPPTAQGTPGVTLTGEGGGEETS